MGSIILRFFPSPCFRRAMMNSWRSSQLQVSMAMVVMSVVILLASAVQCTPIKAQMRASNSEMEERYGVSMDLSQCLEQKRIDFVDAMRNDTHIYYEASQGDNVRFHWHPLAIAFPLTTQDVSQIVQCAKQNGNVQTVARSGGHSFAGFSSGGQDRALIVDFRLMTSIVPDAQHALVHIEPGARLGDVVKSLWADGKRAMPHGTCPTVGVGGHTLCGGVGPTSRKWGMAMDNMIEAEIVLADGSIVHASQHENADLWWALRGAGSFYGLATKFTFTTYNADFPMTEVRYRWSTSLKSADDALKVIQAIQAWGLWKGLPNELGFHIMLTGGKKWESTILLQIRGIYMGDTAAYKRDVASRLNTELTRVGAPVRDEVQEEQVDWYRLMELWDDFGQPGDKLNTNAERKRHNNFVTRTSLSMGQKGFSKSGFERILGTMWQHEIAKQESSQSDTAQQSAFWQWTLFLELFGGVNNRMRDEELVHSSAMAHRDALWLMQGSVGSTPDSPLEHEAYAFLHRLDDVVHSALQDDKIERMGYSCYTDPTLDDWAYRYYGQSLTRMVDLKKKFDPTNLFRTPQSLIETPVQPMAAGQLPWSASPHPLP